MLICTFYVSLYVYTKTYMCDSVDMLVGMLSHFSNVQISATPWTMACQAPLSMGFSRQEYWSWLPCPPPEDLPNPGIEPMSPALQVDSLPLSHLGSPKIAHISPIECGTSNTVLVPSSVS